MEKKRIVVPGAKEGGLPLTLAIECGDYIYISGMISKDLATGKAIPGTIEEETTRVMENIKVILEAAGSCFDKVIKTTIYLKDMSEFGKMNSIYRTYFDPDGIYPTRSAVKAEMVGDVRIEIEMQALK